MTNHRLGEAEPAASGGLSRRGFVGALGATVAGGLLAACSSSDDGDGSSGGGDVGGVATTGSPDLDEALQASDLPELEWDMATSWPIALDTIYGGAQYFCDRVARLTGGRLRITAAPGGELVPPLEVLQSVQTGAVGAGHSASYYYVGLDPVTQFAATVPFGLSARGHMSWMMEGGGLELLQSVFREKFGVVQFPAGNTGAQMGGWFNKEITSLADLGGLRMRIPGLGGSIMEKLGVSVQNIPGGEIYQSLESGAIDAAEWVGPYDDLKQEFNKVTQFYYYPGFWEPGPALDVYFPAEVFDGLPEEYQAAIESAASQAYHQMVAKYDTLNPPALEEIIASGTKLMEFPEDVLSAAQEAANEILDENAAADTTYAEVLESYRAYQTQLDPWMGLAEKSMMNYLSK